MRQTGRQLVDRHPCDLSDFVVVGGQLSTDEPQKIVMHGLMNPEVLGAEPVVDVAQGGEHVAADSGLFGDLANGGLFGSLALFDVALRQ